MIETAKHHITITEAQAGLRLDQALSAIFEQYSRSAIKSWINAGQVTVNAVHPRPRDPVAAGDVVELSVILDRSSELAPEPVEFIEKYADDACLVVEKPAGCVVHPGAGNPGQTLANGLLDVYPELAALPRAGLIHRLDKETSGLLLVARSQLAYQVLTRQMAAREITRRYTALVNGIIIAGGTVDAPIGRDRKNRLKMSVRPDGRAAVTHYRIINKFRAHSLIDVKLETGRTHQIRVHMAHIGHPIVGDSRYGGRPRFPRDPHPDLQTAIRCIDRHALHARELVFDHPIDGHEVAVSSELPQELTKLINAAKTDLAAHQ